MGRMGSETVPSKRALATSHGPSIQISPLSALICPFYIAVLGRGCKPQSWGRERRSGSGIVPFERALVSS